MLTEEMLWDYADGLLTEAEKLRVEACLQQNPQDRARLDGVLAEKRAFAAMPLEKPRAGFADGVMAAWAAAQAQPDAKPAKGRDWILIAIAGLMGALLLSALALGIGMAPSMPELKLPDQYLPQMPVVDWAALLDNAVLRYGIILALAVLSLQILDKYLQQRQRLTMAH